MAKDPCKRLIRLARGARCLRELLSFIEQAQGDLPEGSLERRIVDATERRARRLLENNRVAIESN